MLLIKIQIKNFLVPAIQRLLQTNLLNLKTTQQILKAFINCQLVLQQMSKIQRRFSCAECTKNHFIVSNFAKINFAPISAGLIYPFISFIYFNISMFCCTKKYKDQQKPVQIKQTQSDSQHEGESNYVDKKIEEQAKRIDDKYSFPASFKRAMLHKKAKKFGQIVTGNKSNENPNKIEYKDDQGLKNLTLIKCPCCRQPIDNEDISICYPTGYAQNQNFKLNASTALFFSFIKMAICYSIIIFIFGGLYNLLTSLDGRFCNRNQNICSKTIFELLSTFNKSGDPKHWNDLKNHHYFCLVSVILSIAFFIFYKRSMSKIYQDIDQTKQTQEDYTIFVENIPILHFPSKFQANQIYKIKFDYEKKFKDIFQTVIQQWKRNYPYNTDLLYIDLKKVQQKDAEIKRRKNLDQVKDIVTSISLCFDLSEVRKINQQRQLLMQKNLKTNKNNPDKNPEQINKLNKKQIHTLNKIELQLCKKFASDKNCIFSSTHFIGKAFVSFEYDHYRQYIMQKYERNQIKFDYNDSELVLSRASHPTDIEWINMDVTDEKRLKKIITSYLIVFMVLVFSGLALIEIDYLKLKGIKEGKDISQESKLLNYTLTILGTIFTSAINNGIWKMIVALSGYEKHATITNKIASQIIKAIIAQFINTVLVLYFIQVFNQRPYLNSAGLVVQASTSIVFSGIISMFINALDFSYWYRYAMLWWKYSYYTDDGMIQSNDESNGIIMKDINTYQVKFNKDYELPQFDIMGRYISYLLQIYICMFYFYIIPVGGLATAVIFGIQYWIDKYKLFKNSSDHKELGFFLSKVIFKVFECSLLIFTIGNLIFSKVISDEKQIDPINLISFFIAFAYTCIFVLFPSTSLQRKLLGSSATLEQMSYSNCLNQQKFHETYWTQNPATMFAQEKNINDQGKYINQGVIEVYCAETDFNRERIKQTIKSGLAQLKQKIKETKEYLAEKIKFGGVVVID